MKRASWLHFSDLHLGCRKNNDSWPTIKNELFTDIEKVCSDKLIDFVLFTGDMVFSGKKEQFSDLTIFLEDLWGHFDKLGSKPLLITVPGNHDLKRPEKLNATAKMMLKMESEVDVSDEFWSDGKSEYFEFVSKMTENYMEWKRSTGMPTPSEVYSGYIPGDFSTRFQAGGMSIGVVGLNTAFSHFTDSIDSVVVGAKQLNSVTSDAPDLWSKANDINMLMTHHPPTWLSAKSLETYESLIYHPARFYAHFYGHMHKSNDVVRSDGGAEERRYRQGVSLFGIEKTPAGEDRLHGYAFYSCVENIANRTEELFPRVAVKKHSGAWGIDKDLKFNLDDSGKLSRILCDLGSNCVCEAANSKGEMVSASFREDGDQCLSLVERIDSMSLRRLQWRAPKPQDRHRRVRGGELAQALSYLNDAKLLWVESDWGMGEDHFLGVLLERVQKQDELVFRVDCDGAKCIEALYQSFEEQFGVNLQTFLASASEERGVYIVFDNIESELCDKTGYEFSRILNVLKEYGESISIICLSRCKNTFLESNSVKLNQLCGYEIKEYIEGHSGFSHEMIAEDSLDFISIKSAGVPIIIDDIIEALGVISIDDMADSDIMERAHDRNRDGASPSLVLSVSKFSETQDASYKKSFQLLKILSLLPYGESLKKIKYVHRKNPFYPDDVIRLQKFGLLSPSTAIVYSLSSKRWLEIDASEKILKVSKQVRDYVVSKIPLAEHDQLVTSIADVLFGESWRIGRVKLIDERSVCGRGVRGLGPGNEHEIVKRILRKSAREGGAKEIEKALRVAVSYCLRLGDGDRFRDVVLASSELLVIMEELGCPLDKEILMARARALRMLGRRQESLDLYTEIIESNDDLNKSSLSSIYLNMALAYEKIKQNEKARECAERVVDLVGKNESSSYQARLILLNIDNEDVEKMLLLEEAARNNKCSGAANTICIDAARNLDGKRKIEQYDKILSSDGDIYNKVRAAYEKTIYLFESDELSTVDRRDLSIVSFGYSFHYNQRLKTIFDSCHKALWYMYTIEESIAKMLTIFRLSSLLWRLFREDDMEEYYLKSISEFIDIRLNRDDVIPVMGIDSAYYFSRKEYYQLKGSDFTGGCKHGRS